MNTLFSYAPSQPGSSAQREARGFCRHAWSGILALICFAFLSHDLYAQVTVEFQNRTECEVHVVVLYWENQCPGGGPGGGQTTCTTLTANTITPISIPSGYVVRNVWVYCPDNSTCTNPPDADLACTMSSTNFYCDECGTTCYISGDFAHSVFIVYL